MRYKDDWDKTKQRYIEYWNRENHDRPLIYVTAPKDDYMIETVTAPERIEDRWLNTEYVIKKSRAAFASTYFGGEAFPAICPNLGPDIFGAILGCELEFGERTSWAKHVVDNWDDAGTFRFDRNNKWWKKIKSMTEEVVKDAKGDYLVGITDLHPGADGLVSLRGPENLCFDLIDNPDAVKKHSFEILDIYKEVYYELYNITSKNQQGTTNWMSVWHPGKWYPTSSDFICMISNGMVKEFILPELLEEIDWLDASIFHLDGPGALKHLDTLLNIPKLKGIQWVYGAGQPTASHWIPVLKKIQDAGKLIHITIVPEEIDILLSELAPEGVFYITTCQSEEEAVRLIDKADKSYKKKLY